MARATSRCRGRAPVRTAIRGGTDVPSPGRVFAVPVHERVARVGEERWHARDRVVQVDDPGKPAGKT